MLIIVREVLEHVVEVADAELLERFDAKELSEVVELFPEVGNETDGFGWMLKDEVRALDAGERMAHMVDAYVELEQVKKYRLWPSTVALKVEL